MNRKLAVALILIAAASGLLWFYNQREDAKLKSSQLFIPKQAKITREIELLQKYVRIDTSNPPGKEMAGARFIADYLEHNGIHAEIIESAPGRASVYARLKGRLPNEGLLLLSHIDVVPADPKQWSHPPFAASVQFNMMYGRGSLDMKSITVCQLEAIVAVAKRRRPLERDLVFLAVADEETGGALGMAWLLEHRPDVIEGVRYALNEGGITETRQEEITYFGVEIGTKMTVKTMLRTASLPQMQKVRIALEPFIGPPDPERILPEVREFLHELAPHRIEQRTLLDDIVRTTQLGKFWLLPRGYKELMQNNVWPGHITEDPNGVTMPVNLHNLPDEDPDRRIEWLRGFVKPYGAEIAEILQKTGPAPLTRRDTPLFALLEREVHRQYGNVTVGIEILTAFFNDSRYLRARGIACYGVWPFPVDFYQTQGIHGVDERLRLDWFMQGVDVMKAVVTSYAFDPLPQ